MMVITNGSGWQTERYVVQTTVPSSGLQTAVKSCNTQNTVIQGYTDKGVVTKRQPTKELIVLHRYRDLTATANNSEKSGCVEGLQELVSQVIPATVTLTP